MRAVQIQEFGGPEVLQVVDLPKPEPGDGEVLIEVSRAGMNFADTHQRENSYLARYEVPMVLGGEVAGTTPDGQRVVALLRPGRLRGVRGGPRADGLPDSRRRSTTATALALMIQGLTAWHLFRTSAKLAEGESVVVVSGAGGVGSLAVQLAKPLRRRPRDRHGQQRGEARHDRSSSAPTPLWTPAAEDLKGALIEANEGRPVDVVLEMAGGRVFDASADALAPVRPDRGVRHRRPRAEHARDRAPDAEEPRGDRLLADALPGQARDDGGAARRPVRARGARRARAAGRDDLRALRRAPGARGHARAQRTSGKLLLDPSR